MGSPKANPLKRPARSEQLALGGSLFGTPWKRRKMVRGGASKVFGPLGWPRGSEILEGICSDRAGHFRAVRNPPGPPPRGPGRAPNPLKLVARSEQVASGGSEPPAAAASHGGGDGSEPLEVNCSVRAGRFRGLGTPRRFLFVFFFNFVFFLFSFSFRFVFFFVPFCFLFVFFLFSFCFLF